MPLGLELHPEAVEEARAAREWYAERSPSAASTFMEQLERALHRILEAPLRWPRHTHGTRRHSVRRFPYLVIYRVLGETIQVVAVAHARRKPGYWRRRTKGQ